LSPESVIHCAFAADTLHFTAKAQCWVISVTDTSTSKYIKAKPHDALFVFSCAGYIGGAGSMSRIAAMRHPSEPRARMSVVHILRLMPLARPVNS
jgi:hypothetical protein